MIYKPEKAMVGGYYVLIRAVRILGHNSPDNDNTLENALLYKCDFDVIKLLIDNKATVNNECLSIAVKKKNIRVIKLIMQTGCVINHTDYRLASSVIETNDLEIIDYFVNNGLVIDNYYFSSVTYAIRKKCSFEVVKYLVTNEIIHYRTI